jgi:hypothetical protein
MYCPGRPSHLSGIHTIATSGFPDTRSFFSSYSNRYFSRKRRICRRTCAYIAGVTRPVCVFCWLGW